LTQESHKISLNDTIESLFIEFGTLHYALWGSTLCRIQRGNLKPTHQPCEMHNKPCKCNAMPIRPVVRDALTHTRAFIMNPASRGVPGAHAPSAASLGCCVRAALQMRLSLRKGGNLKASLELIRGLGQLRRRAAMSD